MIIALEEQVRALRDRLAEYSDAYYRLDSPIVPDSEYDRLFREFAHV